MIKKSDLRKSKGFTLIEIIITLAIIGILANTVLLSVRYARDLAKIAETGAFQRETIKAADLYLGDMGFYPPETNVGWDPGFERPLPWNPDAEAGDPNAGVPGTDCSHCPAGWQNIIAANWNGPYMRWISSTPWAGKYDYNYFDISQSRFGCTVPEGVYIGVQRDYLGGNALLGFIEDKMIEKKYDFEQCVNGESQMRVRPIN